MALLARIPIFENADYRHVNELMQFLIEKKYKPNDFVIMNRY